jgi:ABC-type nitrate/sulfonate/bicarbonate transport system permease component
MTDRTRAQASSSTGGALRRIAATLRDWVFYAYPLLLLVLLWEGANRFGLTRPLFLPSVPDVIRQFGAMLVSGEIVGPLALSLYRAFAGLALATAFGVAIGLFMSRSRLVHWAFDPLVSIALPTPKIAFVPIFILWFGIDSLSKILLVAFTCVLPMAVATYHGAIGVSRSVIWSAEAMGTSESKMLYRVILPACMPYIFSGVRVTTPVALITAFTAEMIAGGGGVGANLMFAQRFFQTSTVFVDILVMLITGFAFDFVLLRLRDRLIPWQDEAERQ